MAPATSVDCPKCGHQHAPLPLEAFKDKDSALFQCAACEHVWRYYTRPLAEFEKKLYEAAPPPLTPAQTIDIIGGLRNKSAYQKAIHHYYMDWWLVVIAVIIAIVVLIREVGTIPNFAWFYTQVETRVQQLVDMVTHAAQSAATSDDVIKITPLTSALSMKNNVSLLTIKAEIENTSDKEESLHSIKVELFDKNKEGDWALRQSWIHTPNHESLRPKEKEIIEITGDPKKHALPESIILTFQD